MGASHRTGPLHRSILIREHGGPRPVAKGARGDFARAKMQINHRNRGLGPSKQANTATLQHVSECDLPGPHMHKNAYFEGGAKTGEGM